MKPISSHSSPFSPAAANLSAADYLRILHPSGSRGKVSFFVLIGKDNYATRTHEVSVAPTIAEALLDQTGYVTLNRFYGPRNGSNLAQINALFLDLDVHRLPGSNQPHEHWAEQFQSEVAKKNLPMPSLLTFTGRGLCAIWLLEPIPPVARPRWGKALGSLIELFRHMGADSSCSDTARVFRIPGTTNEKSGLEVRTIGGTLKRYPFDDLADRIFKAAGRPTRRELEEKKRVNHAKPKTNAFGGLSPERRFEMILQDLDKIAAHWGGTIPEGHRNTYLHLVATALTHTKTTSEIEKTVTQIAALATPGLSDREISGVIKSAEKRAEAAISSNPLLDGRLHYSGSEIAERLDISDETARSLGLQQVFSEQERNRRKANREKERRRAAGVQSREDWLACNAASRNKPWEIAGISRTKWYELGLHKNK
ncbi:hypothetical protein [uncultured Roseovarius sp.]|uniref:hypothetical protein n=1 Tax=uncultured Roseovarius sp. TaxID=293344 RepID=UPI002618DF47|nr:hypothetical protein [uncultured Roseovarius sp.]